LCNLVTIESIIHQKGSVAQAALPVPRVYIP
jgi:hypothetical protein